MAGRSHLISAQREGFVRSCREEPFDELSAWIFHADPAPHLPGELRTKCETDAMKHAKKISDVSHSNRGSPKLQGSMNCSILRERLQSATRITRRSEMCSGGIGWNTWTIFT